MRRLLVLAAAFAIAVPTLAAAQYGEEHHEGGPRPGARPVVVPHGPMQPGMRPGGPPGRQFMFRGHPFNPVHLSPFVYPHGYAYRRWAVGGILPPLFLVPAYYYTGYATLGLPPPEPGFQWVRYGPDLLLVNVGSGQVVDVAYGVFY